MKRVHKFVLLLVALPMVVLAEGPVATYTNAQTRLRFPSELGNWVRTAVKVFPEKELGVQVGYARQGFAKADLYIYNGGMTNIPTGVDSKVVQEEFTKTEGHILRLAKMGQYKNVQKILDSTPEITADTGVAKLLVTMYRITIPSYQAEPLFSWILLTGYKNHFLKLRYSHNADEIEKGQEELKMLIAEFLKANESETEHFFVPRKSPNKKKVDGIGTKRAEPSP